MAPAKKREKDNSADGAAPNGLTGLSHGAPPDAGSGSGSGNGHGHAGSTVPPAGEGQIKLNGHQQEQELFLQAFEKPTQIYRYLRNRHETNPIFLNRTLSYMKERMSRNNKKRASFQINSMLDSITQKSEAVSQNYLHVIYDSLHEKLQSATANDSGEDLLQEQLLCEAGESVSVETTLYKITRSKRKDSTLDFQELLSKSSQIVYNPKDRVGEHATISIPLQTMRPMGEQHTLYKLLFRIKVLAPSSCNDENSETPPNKRSRRNEKMFGSELILYEKSSGFITEGEYEAMLQPLNSTSIKSFSPKKCTWETMPDSYIPLSLTYDVYQQSPMLKFHLTLSNELLPEVISAPELQRYVQHLDAVAEMNHNNNNYSNNNNCSGLKNGGGSALCKSTPEHIQIVYNFMYSNNTRQQTEYTQELNCPWCGLDCLRLYALLKHLKLCHARFNFTYQPAGSGARIDVTINDAYDGSYAGSPYDLAGPSGSSFARTCGPVRRTSVTSLMVCRPRRQKTCLDEFLELDEDEISNQRSYITGHNRLYHHTETCLPVHPKELDIDSEGESDPLWLRQKTIQMIDEFSDVNEGEKELMKLWNLHVMRHGFVGDCQLPIACEMFLDAKGTEIVRKNLYRNFILHMCSLFDYGLIAAETVYKTVQKLQGLLSKYAAGQELMQRQREEQLKFWLEVGMHKKQEDPKALKSPQKPTPTADQASTSSASASGCGAVTSSMQPPKRMPAHLKRGGAAAASGSAGKAAENGSNGSNNNSKNVAKKSADQPLSTLANTRERRSDPGQKRKVSGTQTAATPATKRKLSAKDVEQAADGPEVVAHSDNAVDVGIIDEDGDDDDGGHVRAVGANGIANPVGDNCVGN
ncbi:polycomb protein Su(z)12 isoform X2 [Drosophila biarmipes]|uniref:polycomb protein Su(z)12 isoform X2 n=1 Tax=Drosophila biarmipes TaxID=125945 RepID=UPI0007E75710|nr:polycomb protein Su(z)12 isoform X2 [Drosophila biarmipes]XP_016964876.1 polycomb protein Su(z)12 isoform X2 [Drosophila biarmipes]